MYDAQMANLEGRFMAQLRFLTTLVFIALLAGCASTPDEVEALDQHMKTYEKALRWGEYSYAQAMHKDSAEFDPSLMQKLREIKVSAYTSLKSIISPDLQSARQYVEIRYFNEAYAVERVIMDDQKWEYDPVKKSWSITSPFPKFK